MSKTLACPLCSGTIKKIKGDTSNKKKSKPPMIKCENNIFKGGKHTGCNFFMNLAPKPLNGYEFNKEDITIMIDGGEVNIGGIKATYDITSEFNPLLVFPEMEDF